MPQPPALAEELGRMLDLLDSAIAAQTPGEQALLLVVLRGQLIGAMQEMLDRPQ
jgi:hypothetical protein